MEDFSYMTCSIIYELDEVTEAAVEKCFLKILSTRILKNQREMTNTVSEILEKFR